VSSQPSAPNKLNLSLFFGELRADLGMDDELAWFHLWVLHSRTIGKEVINAYQQATAEAEVEISRIEVTLEPVKVMYVEAQGGLSGIKQSWNDLESKLPSLRGRKFYGTYSTKDKVYRACVAVNDETEAKTLHFPMWTIPGGRYLKDRIMDWPSKADLINKTFESMAK